MNTLPLLLTGCFLFAACSPRMSTDPSPTPTPIQESEAIQLNEEPMESPVPKSVVIALAPQNNSGQVGTTTLEEVDGQVRVTIQLTGGNFAAPQPAHIHQGSCPTPGDVLYPLTNVVNGLSVTTIPVSMAAIPQNTELSVNVHRSATQTSIYTACGNIPLQQSDNAQQGGDTSGSPTMQPRTTTMPQR